MPSILPATTINALPNEFLSLTGYGLLDVNAREGNAFVNLMDNDMVRFTSEGGEYNSLYGSGNGDVFATTLGESEDYYSLNSNGSVSITDHGGMYDSAYLFDNGLAKLSFLGDEGVKHMTLIDNDTVFVSHDAVEAQIYADGNGFLVTYGGKSDDVITVWDGNYASISAGDGNNQVSLNYTDYGNVRTGAGMDDVKVAGDADQFANVNTGAGNDTFTGSGKIAILADLGDGNDAARGGAGNDGLTGGAGNDVISGGAGDDILTGGKGKDALMGGKGADGLFGGEDDDLLVVGPGDVAVGGEGANFFTLDPRLGTTGIIQLPDFADQPGNMLDLSKTPLTMADVFEMPNGSIVINNDDLGYTIGIVGTIDSDSIRFADVYDGKG